jgi:uncharacterized protein (DUF2237 family)
MKPARNVLGELLEPCCYAPVTGYTRSGSCETGPQDPGAHTVCAQMTAEFLSFSKARGNDLGAPAPQYRFPGLKPGNRWCLCAERWKEAYDAGAAPPVILSATHEATLAYVPLEALKRHALDLS